MGSSLSATVESYTRWMEHVFQRVARARARARADGGSGFMANAACTADGTEPLELRWEHVDHDLSGACACGVALSLSLWCGMCNVEAHTFIKRM